MGWLRKSSLDLRHRPAIIRDYNFGEELIIKLGTAARNKKHKPRISVSVNCTFFPGREPLTEINKCLNVMLVMVWPVNGS